MQGDGNLKWVIKSVLFIMFLFLLFIILFVKINFFQDPNDKEAILFFQTQHKSLQKVADLVLNSNLSRVRKFSYIPFEISYYFHYENQENEESIISIDAPAFNENDFWEETDTQVLIEKICKEARVEKDDFMYLLQFLKLWRRIFIYEESTKRDHNIQIKFPAEYGFLYEPSEERRGEILMKVRELLVDFGNGWYLAEFPD